MNKRESRRDYSSVEKGSCPTPCMPSGMQPIYFNKLAFLWNAEGIMDSIFYRAVFPTGMARTIRLAGGTGMGKKKFITHNS